MCDCFHLAFPNWHASPGTGAGRRLRGAEPGAEYDSISDEPLQLERERPRPQGSSPVEEFPETDKFTDSDKEGEVDYEPHHKFGCGKRGKKAGLGSLFDKRSTPKMSKLKEAQSPESEMIVKTAKDGGAEGLVVGGGGKEGIFITQVVPESPASKNLSVREGDQILSATVYFDNVTYEDALQILEHAQAYKVKLCLKRKLEITESEPLSHPEVIQEEEVFPLQMRDQGKTKRHGDARISWPKFPSFGKGKKSRFRRSHSTSEAEEQTKLELSPTTSDTESPIKSQEALKGKKRHKVKLYALRKRGQVSTSEDQDTDTVTTGPFNVVDVDPTKEAPQSHSPELFKSPTGEPPPVYITHHIRVTETSDLELQQNDPDVTEAEGQQHKVELISLDRTLKTTDVTEALADQQSPPGKSPDSKKKKKRSELKMKITGKSKAHQQDVKVKASPKRLQTLGASVESTDPMPVDVSAEVTNNRISEVISAKSVPAQVERGMPKVELSFDMKSPQKDKEKLQKKTPKVSKEIKQKTDANTSPTFKLPKTSFKDIAMEETIQKIDVNDQECTIKTRIPKSDMMVKGDPYDRLSESSLSKTQLPKREDIEIPGMEDLSSVRTTTQQIKEPKFDSATHAGEINAETVQMSIDVDSVKEAVSKLPGFKLPKVDISGVPIPEEITMIDANAQRITVKTPTKVLHVKSKVSPDILSSATVKLPNIKPAHLISQEPITETKVDVKEFKKEYSATVKQSTIEIKTEIKQKGTLLKEQETVKTKKKNDGMQWAPETASITEQNKGITDKLPSPKGSDKKSKKAKITMPTLGIAKPDLTFPDVGIDLPKQKLSQQKRSKISIETSHLGKEIQIGGSGDMKFDQAAVQITAPNISSEDSTINVKPPAVELDRKQGAVEMPNISLLIPGAESQVKPLEMEIKEPSVIEAPDGPTLQENADMKQSSFMPMLSFSKPEVKTQVLDGNLPNVDISIPETKLEMTNSGTEAEIDMQGNQFKMTKYGVSLPQADISLAKKRVDVTQQGAKAEVRIPHIELPSAKCQPEVEMKGHEAAVDISAHKIEIEGPSLDVTSRGKEGMGKGGKFKMPSLGISMPKVKGPEIDLSLSNKDANVKLPESKAELKHPDIELSLGKVEIQGPEIEPKGKDVDGPQSQFQMPSFKLPKFGAASPNITVEISKVDNKIDTDLKIPKASVDLSTPNVTVEGPDIDVKNKANEGRGTGINIMMPNLSLSMPKVKAAEIDLSVSKKDGDVTPPEAEDEVNLPEMELLSANVEVKHPEIEPKGKHVEGSQSKFKMPSFKLPKFGSAASNITVEIPEVDKEFDAKMKVPTAEVDMSAPKMTIEGPSIDVSSTGDEGTGKGGNFKMPSLGLSMPKVKGPEIDLGLSKKDIDVTLPEAEVKLPDVEIPSAKVEVKGPDIEFKRKEVEGSQSKFKMPSFKLPKFGSAASNITVEILEVDKEFDAKMKVPTAELDMSAPKMTIQGPSIDVKSKGGEGTGKGGKLKMPSLGLSMPKVKGPEIDLSVSKKDVDVTLPEAEIQLPDVEIPSAKVEVKGPEIDFKGKDMESSPSKFKIPSFKVPKFGTAASNITLEEPDMYKQINIEGGDIEEDVTGDVMAPSIAIKGSSVMEIKTTGVEFEEKGSKFKMLSLGMSMPQVKAPESGPSSSKTDVNITLPETEAVVKIPEVEVKTLSGGISVPAVPKAEVDSTFKKQSWSLPTFSFSKTSVKPPDVNVNIKAPKIDVTLLETKTGMNLSDELKEPSGISIEELPAAELEAKLKKPRFSLPRFSFSKQSIQEPELFIDSPQVGLSLHEEKEELKQSESEMKAPEDGTEIDCQGSKLKLPKFGISLPKVKGPNVDLSVSKKDVDVTLPEAEVKLSDVEIPSAKVEVKGPDIELKGKEVEGLQSKFKMPSFQLPKFGTAASNITVEIPEVDKEFNAKMKVPTAEVDMSAPKMTIEGPSLDVTSKEGEGTGKGGKLKMPSLGLSMPKIKGPEIDLSVSKKDIDVTLPEAEIQLPVVEIPSAKVEVKGPDIELKGKEVEGSQSKFKMPSFKFPKFGSAASNITVEIPEVDKEFDGDLRIPQASVDMSAPKMTIEGPSIDVTRTGDEGTGKGGKLKMPSLGLSMPKIKGPEFELGLSKKDVDVTLPEAEVKLPDVEIPSAKVEVKGPDIELKGKEVEGSQSKFKIPSFQLPKFGTAASNITVEIPEVDKEFDAKMKVPTAEVDMSAPKMSIEGPSIDVTRTGDEGTGKGGKFKMPSLGLLMPKIKGPEIDLSVSKKDVDVTLPGAEIQLPVVEIPSAKVEVKGPDIELKGKDVEGSQSKFKMPSFKLPKFGSAASNITVEIPEVDEEFDGDLKIPQASVDIAAPKMTIQGPSIDVKSKGGEGTGKGGKLKMPSLGLSMPKAKGPQIDFSVSKKDADVTLPEAEVKLPDVEIPSAKVEVKGPDIELKGKEVEGSPSKFKMPSFKLPKFGSAASNITVEIPEVEQEFDAKMKVPRAEVDMSAPKMSIEGPSIDVTSKGGEGTGKGGKFKMPSLGLSMPKVKGPEIDLGLSKKDVDVTLAGAEVKLPDVEIPSVEVEVKGPDIELKGKEVEGSPSKFKMPSFKLPKFGSAASNITVEIPEVDKEFDGDLKIPQASVDIAAPKMTIQGPSIDVTSKGGEGTGKGGKLKMPSLGLSMPKVKGPEIDLSVSKKDVDVTLPEAEIQLPVVEIPTAKVEVKGPDIELKGKEVGGSQSKFKMPSFKLPTFGTAASNITVEIPEVAKEFDAKMKVPTAEVDMSARKMTIEGPSIDVTRTRHEGSGKGGKLKMPSLGLSMPKAKGPQIDFSESKKDIDVTLPEAEVKLPDVEIPSAKVEVKGPDIELKGKEVEGSQSKFKMPAFKLPKFGSAASNITVEITEVDKEFDGDLKIPQASVDIAAPKMTIEGPSIDVKSKGGEGTGKGGKLKMPSLGLSMPKVKGPEIDLSVSKKDVDVTLPEAEIQLPDVEIPSAKVEVKGPDIELKGKEVEGSPSKFKMPSFKFPKFGSAASNITVEIPEVDKEFDGDLKIPQASVDIAAPKMTIQGPSIDVKSKGGEGTGKGGKLKMPSLGLSMPKVKGPEFELGLSKKDVDVTLPEAEVKLPDVEIPSAKVEVKGPDIELKGKEVEGSPSKFKMPSFKLPKFGTAASNITVEIPEVEQEFDAKMKVPRAEVEMSAPKMTIEGPSIDVTSKGGEGTGKGGKFKMPSLGLSMPKVKGPEIDLGLSKKDVDVTLAGAEVKLPDVEIPSVEVEVKGPDIELKGKEVEGSPSKFKMPSFKLPKFGSAASNITVEIPEVDKEFDGDLKIPQASVDIAAPKMTIQGPSIDVTSKGGEGTGKGGKLKMQSLGLSMPKVKGPEIDLSVSKKDVDVTLPEAEIQLPVVEIPTAKVEVKGPDIELKGKEVGGSQSKFKMPSFKLPTFGTAASNITVEIPEVAKEFDAKMKVPTAEVDMSAPKMTIEGPSIEITSKGGEGTGKGGKLKMPSLGLSMPKAKGPQIDFSVSKKDIDVTLPEAEVKLPDVEIPSAKVEVKGPDIELKGKEVEGSQSKFKMPAFKLPKFGSAASNITVEITEVDKKFDGDLKIPQASVDIAAPKMTIEGPSIDVKSKGGEGTGKGGKLKMPSLGLSMPKVKGPEIDLSVSKKDVDVTLPEAEIQLPDVEIPSAKVEVKGPDIELKGKEVEGSPSKFKMPSFKFPKFGSAASNITVEIPEVDKEFDGDLKIPQASVDIAAPKMTIQGPSIDVKSKGGEGTGKGGKLKMPSLDLSMPKAKGPQIDFSVSKKDADVTLPEAEVKLPDVEIPSAKVEVKGPDIELKGKEVEGSQSKFKMPSFKLPKFGSAASNITVEIPEVDKEFDGDLKIPQASVDMSAPKMTIEGPSIDVTSKGGEGTGKGGKLKMPSLGLSMPKVKGPEIDLGLSKKDVDVTLPEAEVKLPDVEIPSAKVEVKGPDIELKGKEVEGSPSTFKMPSFKLPNFGAAASNITVEIPEVQQEFDAKMKVPTAEVDRSAPKMSIEGPSIDVTSKGGEGTGKGGKFKMPSLGLSMPKVKGPEIDLGLSKKDVDVTLPEAEVKLPDVEIPSAKVEVKGPDIEFKGKDVEGSQSKFKMPPFKLSNTDQTESEGKAGTFKIQGLGTKGPEMDVSLSKQDMDVTISEHEAGITPSAADVKEPSMDTVKEPPTLELDVKLKKTRFSFPKFSLSKASVKESETEHSVPQLEEASPAGNITITQQETEVGAESRSEQKAAEGSALTLKLPTIKMSTFGEDTSNVTAKGRKQDVSSVGAAIKTCEVEAAADIKTPSFDAKKDEQEKDASHSVTTGPVQGSPSKFKLPSFKMPRLSFSKPKLEDEYLPVNTECENNQLEVEVEPQEARKSPSRSLLSPSDLLKGFDVEFNVPKIQQEEEKMTPSEEETNKAAGQNVVESRVQKDDDIFKAKFKFPTLTLIRSSPETEAAPQTNVTEEDGNARKSEAKGANGQQASSKSPERVAWFKFPKFGSSSPSEPAKKAERGSERSSAAATPEEDASTTCSLRSSDAFADVSSTATGELAGLSSPSPTKVTVKYSDPDAAAGLREVRANVITSTAKTRRISVEPDLPEKVVLSSGFSSSSAETLKLESEKIHVITSNIQATPQVQQTTLMTRFHIRSAGGLSPTEMGEGDEPHRTRRDESTATERLVTWETSGEVNTTVTRKTVVITKQVSRGSGADHGYEPISGETASSIQRLRDTVHSEKMKFFDGEQM